MILVTGGVGFIGSHVIQELVRCGHGVVGIDNFDDYYDVSLKRERWERLQNTSDKNQLFLFEGDILNRGFMKGLFQSHSIDAVVNLAAMAGVRNSIVNPNKYVQVNTQGSLSLLETMKEFDCNVYVMASTSSLYAGQTMPFVESMDVRWPISPYASSKLGAESMAYTFSHIHGINVRILRYFTVYGPSGRPDMLSFRLCEWVRRGQPIEIFGDGEHSRDFTFVEDVASATRLAMESSSLDGYEIFNVGGGGNRISMNALIELVEDTFGKKAQVEYLPQVSGDMKHTQSEIEKAQRKLGWSPSVSIEEGVARMTAWHNQNADWLNRINF